MDEAYIISKNIKNFNECIKLDLNEYDFEHPKELYSILSNSLSYPKTISHYSNSFNDTTKELLSKLSNLNNVLNENIIITAGSDNALEYIVEKYINKKTNILLFVPTYSYFELLLKRKNNNIIYVPIDFNDSNYSIYDCLEFYKDLLQENSLIYIVNPNNPLGVSININNLKKCLLEYTKTIFVIDEAYIELNIKNTCVDFIKEFNNIIITRTFSKVYGLAGIRLGYLISSLNIINNIKKIYNEKNVTDIAKTAGNYILNNLDYYNIIIKTIIYNRENFSNFLQINNIYYINSVANFISLYIGKNVDSFIKILEHNNIYIRNRSDQINMKGFIRISIGKQEHMILIKQIILDNINLFETLNPIVSYFTPKKHLWKLLKLFKIFNDCVCNELNYWFDGGSLLGVYRNERVIPWDDDIDLGILESDCNKLLNLRDVLNKNGLRIKLNRTKCYYQIDYIEDIIDKEITNDIHLDIFLYKYDINRKILLNTDSRFNIMDDYKCNIVYTYDDLYPLKDSFFYTIPIKIPKNTEKLLQRAFGNNNFKNIGILKENEKTHYINIKDYIS